jgi:hypothetical protein
MGTKSLVLDGAEIFRLTKLPILGMAVAKILALGKERVPVFM